MTKKNEEKMYSSIYFDENCNMQVFILTENIREHLPLKTKQFFTFFLLVFLPSRIRIQLTKINADLQTRSTS
jgi:hypothetical protein